MSEEKTGSMDPWVKQQFFEMIQQKCVMLFLWKYSTIRTDYNDYDNGFSLTKFDNNTTAYIQAYLDGKKEYTGTSPQSETRL